MVVTKAITLQSVNGPEVTIIQGQGPFGPGACRCVYMTNGALLGFTLTGGATLTAGDGNYDQRGGGALVVSSGLLSNCVICANSAYGRAGGLYLWSGGRVVNSTLQGNTSAQSAGGAYMLYGGELSGCLVASNQCGTSYNAGGLYCYSGAGGNPNVTNCALIGNSATYGGGVAVYCSTAASTVTINNCRFEGNTADQGGAINCLNQNGVIRNCLIKHNRARWWAGGVFLRLGSQLLNSSVFDNRCGGNGGGVEMADACLMKNCTVLGNYAAGGGSGVVFFNTVQTLENSIVWGSEGTALFAGTGPAYPTTNLNNCLQGWTGGGANLSTDPLLIDSYHLGPSSPCIGAGLSGVSTGTDLDGQPWQTAPAIGCDEYYAGSTTGPLTAAIAAPATTIAAQYSCRFAADITGTPNQLIWSFGDGTTATNGAVASHPWSAPGDYPVTLTAFNDSNPGGVSATVTVHVVANAICRVSLASLNPHPPYASWDTAATNIQDAVASCLPGGTVLGTNGVYGFGSYLAPGVALPSRVLVTNDIILRSVNGPDVICIQGQGFWDGSQFTNGSAAVRCVYLSAGQLSGFTLTGGYTLTNGEANTEVSGGGACALGGMLTNCTIVNKGAVQYAGGVSSGGYYVGGAILWNCLLASNYTVNAGGAAFDSILHHCTIQANQCTASGGWGGGLHCCTAYDCLLIGNGNSIGQGGAASYSTLVRCQVLTNVAWAGALNQAVAVDSTFVGNTAVWGGAANHSSLTNCVLIGNFASGDGGGIVNGVLANCTVMFNSATSHGGGAAYSSVFNSLIASNSSVLAGGGIYNSASSNYLVASSQIIGNQAGTDGGGLHLDSGGSVLNSVIASNQSLNYGGGVSVSNNGLVANCQILGNAANNGGGGYNYSAAYSGGGVWSADASGVISNCVISGCVAANLAGGIYQGTVFNCQIFSNSAYAPGMGEPSEGGGTCGSVVYDSTFGGNYAYYFGGGAYGGTLHRCTFSGNSGYLGGGAHGSVVYDSLFVSNFAFDHAGAAWGCTLYGCTLTGNSASLSWGGAAGGTLYNSIAYGNSGGDASYSDAYFSCAPELTAGVNGNITNAPVFANLAAGTASSETSPAAWWWITSASPIN